MVCAKSNPFKSPPSPRRNQHDVLLLLGCASLMALASGTVCHGSQITFERSALSDPVAIITFNEVALGSQDPEFAFKIQDFGPLTVSFGSIFVGQGLGPMGNSLTVTQPSSPLQLDRNGPKVATLLDLRSASPPVLGGAAGNGLFTTPLAIQFSRPVNAFSFEIGSFDGPETTFVEVYDALGNVLGMTRNLGSNFETIAARSDEANISGASIFSTEVKDWEGFGLNNFAVSAIPEPGGGVLAGWLLILGGFARKKRSSR